jgi:polysaccharide chain length determinant protein (PEP-CTERM system associated)
MENPLNKQPDISKYLRLCWRKKWLILVPIVLFPAAAGYSVMQLPDQYKSTTLILVQAQKVPTSFVPSTVTTNIAERLNTISQQILSRTRLEEIIQEFDLFAREKKAKLSPEEIVELMRRKIELNVHRNDAFELNYVDANPRLAMLVTNKLASLFIEENLKAREQQAIGTSQFLSDEIERVREQVREKEQIILGYKSRHMNELSDQVTSNQARLGQLQNQLQINTQEMNAAEDRKLKLQQSLADVERRAQEEYELKKASKGAKVKSISDELMEQFMAGSGEGDRLDDSSIRALQAEIRKQEKEFQRLRLTYTDRHPDALKAQTQIRRLQGQLEKEKADFDAKKAEAARTRKSAAETGPATDVEVGVVYPPAHARLKADIARADADISRLNAQNREIHRAVEVYQARIAAVPTRELGMKQISEDYANLKGTLDNLVAKKLQADLSENLEKKQKGEQFQVLDPANLPEKPFFPNRARYVAGALAAGAALGFGLVFLLDFADLSVRTKEELSAVANLTVLGAIPEIVTPGDHRRRKAFRLGISGGLAAFALVAVIVVHFAVKPVPQALGDLIAQVRSTHWTTMK